MQYVTKKCPHCNFAYVINEQKGSGYYGSPIRICRRCGKTFVDKDYIEIAVSGIREVDKQHVSLQTILISLTCIAMGAGFLYLFQETLSVIIAIVLFVVSIVMVIKEYSEYGARQDYLSAEKFNSEKRLENYEYALMLKELGYNVPEKYLAEKQD